MTTLLPRVRGAAVLLSTLVVPLAFIGCGADDPLGPAEASSSPVYAKGGNGKGGGSGGDDGGSGTSTPTIQGELVPGMPTDGDRLSIMAVAGSYVTGHMRTPSEYCGFVYRISAESYECIVIPDAAHGLVWPFGVRADGLLATSYEATDGEGKTAVFDIGPDGTIDGAAWTPVSAPDPYTYISPAARQPINAAGQILVDLKRALANEPGPWRLGVLSADLQTVTMTSGDEYDWVSGRGLSDDGYAITWARELGAPERDAIHGSWSLSGDDRVVALPGTGGGKGATVSGVFAGSGTGLYGQDSDGRPAVWADPGSAPVPVADVEFRPMGHDAGGRIFGTVPGKGKDPARTYCLDPATGLMTELAPPAGHENVTHVRGASGSVVFGTASGSTSGTAVAAMWDLSTVSGGCY